MQHESSFGGSQFKRNLHEGKNYRGVQLTPVLSKVSEWIVADFLIPFLEEERRVAMGTINGLIEKVEALAILYQTSLQRCNAAASPLVFLFSRPHGGIIYERYFGLSLIHF